MVLPRFYVNTLLHKGSEWEPEGVKYSKVVGYGRAIGVVFNVPFKGTESAHKEEYYAYSWNIEINQMFTLHYCVQKVDYVVERIKSGAQQFLSRTTLYAIISGQNCFTSPSYIHHFQWTGNYRVLLCRSLLGNVKANKMFIFHKR